MIKMKKTMKVIMINQIKMKKVKNMIKVEPNLTEREVEKEILDIVEIAEKKINTGATIGIKMTIEKGETWETTEIVIIIEIEGIKEIGMIIEAIIGIGAVKEIEEIEEIIEIAIGKEIEIMISIQKEMKNKKIQKDMAQEVIKILSRIKKIANRMDHI